MVYDEPDRTNVRCGDRVTSENVARCVKLRGLPYSTSKIDVVEFFKGYNLRGGECAVTLDTQHGKNTGYAIAELDSAQEAAKAVHQLHKQCIGGRWIGVTQAEVLKKRDTVH